MAEGKRNGEWTLVWSDEFDGDRIDPSKWAFDIGNGFVDYPRQVWIPGFHGRSTAQASNATSLSGTDLRHRGAMTAGLRRVWVALMCVLPLLACGGGAGAEASAFATATPAAAAASPDAPAGYVLVWSDEFDRDGQPDASRWDYDTGRNLLGWFNNERQYYARARPENALVSNGQLRITARHEDLRSATDWGGQHYTSARLLTRGRADWTYGFFEVRAKLPCGRGTWPAIWTLGSHGVWPDAGEIDLMEQVGSNPSRVFGTVHTLQSGGVGTGAAVQVPDACTRFHNYQLHWTADALEIGIDGIVHYRYTNARAGASSWPFDAPQFLLINLAIGGDLGGNIDDSIFPVTLEIEHVRVFQTAR